MLKMKKDRITNEKIHIGIKEETMDSDVWAHVMTCWIVEKMGKEDRDQNMFTGNEGYSMWDFQRSWHGRQSYGHGTDIKILRFDLF